MELSRQQENAQARFNRAKQLFEATPPLMSVARALVERRTNPKDDLLTTWAQVTDDDGELLPPEDLSHMALIMFAAGLVYNNYEQDRQNGPDACVPTFGVDVDLTHFVSSPPLGIQRG